MKKNKKIIIKLIVLCLLLQGCKDKKEVIINYWKNNGEVTKKISLKCTLVNQKLDGYCYKYYENGQLMSKVLYNEDRLVKIISVFDTLGNKLDYGKLDKNGTGFVISYSDLSGKRTYSGKYINGRKEGWWKNYLYEGASNDSIFYKDSHPDYMPSLNDVMY